MAGIEFGTEATYQARRYLMNMGRNAFPVVIRKTLNDIAMDMKGKGGKRKKSNGRIIAGRKGTMLQQAESMFEYQRNKTFIKAMTGASFARGMNINSMEAGAGIVSRSGRTKAAEGLARQQTGKDIDHRYAPLPKARISEEEVRRVAKGKTHSRKGDMIDTTSMSKTKFVAAKYKAKKEKKSLLVNGRNKRLIAVPYGRSKKRGGSGVKLKFIYQENSSGKAKLKKKAPFVVKAAEQSIRRSNYYFNKNTDKMMRRMR